MKAVRTLLALVLSLSLVLAGFAGTARASGIQWPTESQSLAARDSYLKSLAGGSAATGSTLKGNTAVATKVAPTVIDGITIPQDVTALKSFKDGFIDVIIGLPGEPLISYASQHGMSVATMTAAQAAPALDAVRTEQGRTVNSLTNAGVQLTGVKHFSITYNGVAATIRTADLGTVARIVGSQNLHLSRIFTISDDYANAQIGVDPGVRQDLGLDGTGMTVGVVDTGVDYTHPDLGGSGTGTTFPTSKIVAGYDFGDGDTDPMDTNGHGTHVSGIIAADGSTFKGVAPKAHIVIAKIVQGGTGSADTATIVAAFEYMADPNNLDGGPEGAHPAVASVNMSFGAPSGFVDTLDPEHVAVENCVAQGIVVTLAAGNETDYYYGSFGTPWYPDYGVVGDPSVTAGAISVASSENSVAPGIAMSVAYNAGSMEICYAEGSTSPNVVTALGDNTGAGYGLVDCGYGLSASDFPPSVAGKLALISRGSAPFAVKINNAAAAGAVGAIIYNNTTGTVSMNTSGATLPSMSITKADGLALAAVAATANIKFLGLTRLDNPNGLAGQMSYYSSWGPGPDLSFKPDMTAPGGNIWSTVPVAQGSYANYSGTSMAAPHVAAAAALIKEEHPSWTVAQVKVALSNTGDLLLDPASNSGAGDLPYSPRLMGAGRINVEHALHTDVTAVNAADGKPTVALGSLTSYAVDPTYFTVVLRNSGSASVTYTIGSTVQTTDWYATLEAVTLPGAVVTTIPSGTVTVPAGGSRSVLVAVDATGVSPSWDYFPFIEGFVSFTPGDSGVAALHVPYMGFLGNYNGFDAGGPTFNPVIDLPGGGATYTSFSSWFFRLMYAPSSYTSYSYWYTGVTWPEDPTQGYEPMGQKYNGVYDLSTVAINPNHTYQSAVQANIWLLRNAQNVTVSVRDAASNPVKAIDSVDYLWKGDPYRYSPFEGEPYTWYWSGNVDWTWRGRNESNAVVPDGQYYLDVTATPQKLVNSPGYDTPQTVTFPVFVDKVAPQVTIDSVVPSGTTQTVTWHATDAAPSSGMWGFLVWLSNDAGAHWTYQIVSPSTTSVVVPRGFLVQVDGYDNASNVGYDRYAVGELSISSTLPSSIVDGVQASFSVSVTNTGVAINDMRYDLTLATPASWTTGTFVVQYYDTNTSQWLNLPFTGSGGSFTSSFGPYTGFTFPAATTITTQFRFQSLINAPSGSGSLMVKAVTVDPGTGAVVSLIRSATFTTQFLPNRPTVGIGALPAGYNTCSYSYALPISGGQAPYVVTATGLPAGLSMSSSGVVSGPLSLPAGGPWNYTVSVTVTDAAAQIVTVNLPLAIHYLTVTNLPATVTANNIMTPVTYVVTTADLIGASLSVSSITASGGGAYVPMHAPSFAAGTIFSWQPDFADQGKTLTFTIHGERTVTPPGGTPTVLSFNAPLTVKVGFQNLIIARDGTNGNVFMASTTTKLIRFVTSTYDTGWMPSATFQYSGSMLSATATRGYAVIANLNLTSKAGLVTCRNLSTGKTDVVAWKGL